MLRSKSIAQKPVAIRILSLVLAIVAACFAVLLIFNTFRNGKPVAWQMLIITSLAEAFFDAVIRQFDTWSE